MTALAGGKHIFGSLPHSRRETQARPAASMKVQSECCVVSVRAECTGPNLCTADDIIKIGGDFHLRGSVDDQSENPAKLCAYCGLAPAVEAEHVIAQCIIPKPRPTMITVFIVHGHDNEAKLEVARLLERLKLKPIILHEQPNRGKTIIEKFESNASDVAYAVILLTPDDIGQSKRENDSGFQDRARQNVVFEMGFFYAKLGRERVSALIKGETEQPPAHPPPTYRA